MSQGNPRIIHLDILCYKEEDYFVAHCLQMDLVTTANTVDDAFVEMKELIMTQIEFAAENNNMENIFKPAPREIWRRLVKAKPVNDDQIETLKLSILPTEQIYQVQRLCA